MVLFGRISWNFDQIGQILEDLHLVAHPVHLLDVGKHHLGIYPLLGNHVEHVVGCEEVGNSGKSLSSLECKLKILLDVVHRQFVVVKCMGEEIVNEGTESQTIGPGVGEVLDSHIFVLPASALTPDHDSLHLGGHHLEAGALRTDDSQLQSHASVCGHATTLAVRVEAG